MTLRRSFIYQRKRFGRSNHCEQGVRGARTELTCVSARSLLTADVWPHPSAQGFSYYTFDDKTPDRMRYLISDVSINIDVDEEYLPVFVASCLAIAIYAFGLLAFNAVLLFLARKAILNNKPTPLSTALRFFYKECVLLICR